MELLEEIVNRYKDIPIDVVFKKYGIDLKITGELKTGNDITTFKRIVEDMMEDSRKETGWLFTDSTNVNHHLPYNIDLKNKIHQKTFRRKKQYLKSKRKIESQELIYSINASGNKMIRNIRFLVYQRHDIHFEGRKPSNFPNKFPVLDTLYKLLKDYRHHLKNEKNIYEYNEFDDIDEDNHEEVPAKNKRKVAINEIDFDNDI